MSFKKISQLTIAEENSNHEAVVEKSSSVKSYSSAPNLDVSDEAEQELLQLCDDVRESSSSFNTSDRSKCLDIENLSEDSTGRTSPKYNREEILEQYRAVVADRKVLLKKSKEVQGKLSDYFRKKRPEDADRMYEKPTTEQRERYFRFLGEWDNLRNQEREERRQYETKIERVKDETEERIKTTNMTLENYLQMKHTAALGSTSNAEQHELILQKIFNQLEKERKKEEHVSEIRLKNIQLELQLRKQSQKLRDKDSLGIGTQMIDFEQLRVENMAYSEKIEERKEDIIRLRKKMTNAVHQLAHVREKISHVVQHNSELYDRLHEVDAHLFKKREEVTEVKQQCEHVRQTVRKMTAEHGLIGKKNLLLDLQQSKLTCAALENELGELKVEYDKVNGRLLELNRKINTVHT